MTKATLKTNEKRGGVNSVTVQEGYVQKGGMNTTYQIQTRPGKPAALKPQSQTTGNGNEGGNGASTETDSK